VTVQERTASALWAIAGDDLDEQRTIAGLMGVSTLVDFLKARPDFEQLSLIGSECLGVLAHGPRNKQTAIANANGVGKVGNTARSIGTANYSCDKQDHSVLYLY